MIFDSIWWVVAITALVLWFPQTVQHEGMHAIAARHWGATITTFKPYRHKGTDGKWRWGAMSWEGGDYDDTARGLISIAPQFANTVILCFIIGVRWRFPDMPQVLASILAGWYITNAVDCGYSIGVFFRKQPTKPSSDGWKFAQKLKLSPATCRLAMATWYLWFGFHLFVPSWLVH